MTETDQPDEKQAAAPIPRRAPATGRRALLLCRKELRETLRDRRTIITLLAMPLLLYPLLGMVFRFMAVSQLRKASGPEYLIAVASDAEAVWLRQALEIGEQLLVERRQSAARPAASDSTTAPESAVAGAAGEEDRVDTVASPPVPGIPGLTTAEPQAAAAASPRVRLMTSNEPVSMDLAAIVAGSAADLGVRVELPQAGAVGAAGGISEARVQLWLNQDVSVSREAQRYVEDRLQAANLYFLLNVARRQQADLQLPIHTSLTEVASSQKSRGFLGLLPLILLLMTVTGGVYPAIDLTAGERERDTLETLIALPIPRVQLLLAKYVAVFTVTLLTGLMNLLAMTATVYTLRMETQLFGEGGVTVRLALALLLILSVFGLFYSAVLLALTSSSRSFKEAQAYLIPLMLMSIAPGLVILLPGWQLDGLICVVPLVNMLLLARDVFEGTVQAVPAIITVVSTLVYAAGALTLAAQLFGADAIAVGSRGTWSDLLRRPAVSRARPSLTAALMTLGLMFPLYFFANGLLSRTADADPQTRLITSGALTVVLFGLYPLCVAGYRRLQLAGTWQLPAPPALVWLPAVVLGLGSWPWVYELVLWTQQLGLVQLDAERLQQVAEILERWRQVPLVVMVVCLGVLPGVFEELFFRGYLLSALRGALRPATAILLCGLVFGVFHVIAAEGLAIERLLPSACLGCLLSWVAVRTDSVWPGMLLHVLHNSSLLLIAHFRDELAGLAVGAAQQEHLPGGWLLASGVALLAGTAGVWLSTRGTAVTTSGESSVSGPDGASRKT